MNLQKFSKILLIANDFVPVPPPKYGGTERIAHILCEGLASRGYQIDLLANKKSNIYSGRLFTYKTNSNGLINRILSKLLLIIKIWFIIIIRRPNCIISFTRLDIIKYVKWSRIPYIQRFGNPLAPDEIALIKAINYPKLSLVAGSYSQISEIDIKDRFVVVYNGHIAGNFIFHEKPFEEKYIAFVGILSKSKGIDLAIEIALRTQVKLKIAGKKSEKPDELVFFKNFVEPHLSNPLIEWVGLIGDAEKSDFFGGAIATVFPIRDPEVIGNVMIESMFCGTPVIGINKYCVSEVIEDGISGYVCNTVDEMVDTVKNIGIIDRHKCRDYANDKFSCNNMVLNYIRLINN